MPGVSGDFPVQLATRLPDWSAGGLLQCNAARLYVCCVVLQSQRARHARNFREDPRSIFVRHVRHTRFPRDTSETSLRGCREDARKPLPWNLALTAVGIFLFA